ncbi:MAG: tyrosine-type recombinase/integrase [Acidimicrobiales bacterium]
MSELRTAAEDYVAMRRGLGFKFGLQGRLLMQLVEHLERCQLETVTTEAAITWASAPADASPVWHGMRFGVARRFAVHLQLLDPSCEIPPRDALPERYHRLPPHIYSTEEIAALMAAARHLRPALRAATAETVVGLLAATGMRSGEIVRLNQSDVDLDARTIRILATKRGASRELTLHESTVAALAAYARQREERFPAADTPSFFVSSSGHRLGQGTLETTFRLLVRAAGLEPPTGSRARSPRPQDVRHSFAVSTLVAWYRSGEDVGSHMPALSAYLGHTDPKDTYWYLSAVPELLALASERAEEQRGRR